MLEWLNKRKKEVTTWTVGVPSIVMGIMTIFDADNAQEVSGVIASQGEIIAQGNWTTALMMLGLGIVGIFAKERD